MSPGQGHQGDVLSQVFAVELRQKGAEWLTHFLHAIGEQQEQPGCDGLAREELAQGPSKTLLDSWCTSLAGASGESECELNRRNGGDRRAVPRNGRYESAVSHPVHEIAPKT